MPTEADRLALALALWRDVSVPWTMSNAEYAKLRLRHARYVLGLPGSMAKDHRESRDFYRGMVRRWPA